MHGQEVVERDRSIPSPLARYFALAFAPTARVLDVGAGTGREIEALLRERVDAYGVEPAEVLRAEAVRRVGPSRVLAGDLPDLAVPGKGEWDGLLCSAVLQHLPRSQLFDAVNVLRDLLKQGGRALVSVPLGVRPGLDVEGRDEWGRLFTPLQPDELQLLFERVGFSTLMRREDGDALGRPGVSWVVFLFELGPASGQRPADQLASVLSKHEDKVTTYKLALLKALNEIAMTQPHRARWLPEGRVGVPIEAIVERWLQYYWRLFSAPKFLPQKNGDRETHHLGFARQLNGLIAHFKPLGGYLVFESAEADGLEGAALALHGRAARAVRSAIIKGPVAHAGGARRSPLFSFADGLLVMPSPLWRELSLLGHWLGDALVLRWAEFSARLAEVSCSKDPRRSQTRVAVGDVLSALMPQQTQRETAEVRQLFESGGECVWTGVRIRGKALHIDHVLPWAHWHNNDLWNLVPALASVNSSKSDGLPERRFLRSRRHAFVEAWARTREAWPERFSRQAGAQLGRLVTPEESIFAELFEVMSEAVERTRLQHGMDGWVPRTSAA